MNSHRFSRAHSNASSSKFAASMSQSPIPIIPSMCRGSPSLGKGLGTTSCGASETMMDTSRRCNHGRVAACRSGYVAGKGVGHSCRRPLYHPVLTKPRPAFRAVFQVAITRADSGVILIKEPPDPSQKAPSPDSGSFPVAGPRPHSRLRMFHVR